MNKKTLFLTIFILIVVVVIIVFTTRFLLGGPEDDWICDRGQWVKHGMPSAPMPTTGCGQPAIMVKNFKECVNAGFAVMESYPRQCRDNAGILFVEDIGNRLEKLDLIVVDDPQLNQPVVSPLIIKGKARGSWFFEAVFPVKLLDSNGNLLAVGFAQAKGEWMIEDFVLFESTLQFTSPTSESGVLILEKDNPSGLPENFDQLIVPVLFQ